MAISREAVEKSLICPDWCPDEYFDPTRGPGYVTPDSPKDRNARNFVNKTVLFYQKSFNSSYPNLATNETSQKAFDSALVEQEPGGRVIYQAMRRRQLARSSKAQR